MISVFVCLNMRMYMSYYFILINPQVTLSQCQLLASQASQSEAAK